MDATIILDRYLNNNTGSLFEDTLFMIYFPIPLILESISSLILCGDVFELEFISWFI